MYNYFSNKTKAEVLTDLSKKKLKFKVPKTLFFKVNDWFDQREIILKKIVIEFKKNKYVSNESYQTLQLLEKNKLIESYYLIKRITKNNAINKKYISLSFKKNMKIIK